MLIKSWKKNQENVKIVDAVFMNLSKTFDCTQHNYLLIAKMESYDLNEDFLTFLYSCLKHRKQFVNINIVYSIFQILFPGVPKESVLGTCSSTLLKWSISFHKSRRVLLFWLWQHNSYLFKQYWWLTELQKKSEKEIDWLHSNEMVVYPDKFLSIIINMLGKLMVSYKIIIGNHEIDLENAVSLLGIKIDNKLNFQKHVTAIVRRLATN